MGNRERGVGYMGSKKKSRPGRQPMVVRVKKARINQDSGGGSSVLQLAGAGPCDFFYYFWKGFKWILLTGLILTASVALYFFLRYGDTYRQYEKEADQLVADSKAEDFRMDEITYIYAEDGGEIAELSSGNGRSSYLEYDEIPKAAVDAFVAVEDRSFWRNIGIDVKGIVRVIVDYVSGNSDNLAGASTITQQLSRTIYLTRERSFERKIKEMMIAIRLTRKYSWLRTTSLI